MDRDGVHPDAVAPVGEPLAGWIAPQLHLQDLLVRATVEGDRELAFQALVEGPALTPDEAACRAMFDELCELQAEHLPF